MYEQLLAYLSSGFECAISMGCRKWLDESEKADGSTIMISMDWSRMRMGWIHKGEGRGWRVFEIENAFLET